MFIEHLSNFPCCLCVSCEGPGTTIRRAPNLQGVPEPTRDPVFCGASWHQVRTVEPHMFCLLGWEQLLFCNGMCKVCLGDDFVELAEKVLV